MINRNRHIINKKLGQHFLIDLEIIDKIVNVVNPKNNDFMVEIGPGLGALTYPICKILNELVVIEYDKTLGTELLNNLKNVKVFIQNVLNFNFFNLVNDINQSIRIIGNLPYNISIPILTHLFKFSNSIIDMHFMFQKEVANRLLAQPDTKNYGRLSIITQYFYKVIFLFDVRPKSFFPVPKVTSAFVRLIPKKINKLYLKNIDKLSYVTTLAFCQRRKTIKNSLSSLFSVNTLKKLGISPYFRAENLSVQQYCLLSNYISEI